MKIPLGQSTGFYEITARILTTNHEVRNGEPYTWPGEAHIPTFYLHEAVDGVVSAEHAGRMARNILDPLSIIGHDKLIIWVTRKPHGGYWASHPRIGLAQSE